MSQQGLHVTLTWNILHARGSSTFPFGKTEEIEPVFAFTCFACFRASTVFTHDARVWDSIPNHGPHIAERSHLRISTDIFKLLGNITLVAWWLFSMTLPELPLHPGSI